MAQNEDVSLVTSILNAGRQCGCETLKNMALGYRFRTDILTMRFANPEIASLEEALSVLYGLLEGAGKGGELQWKSPEEIAREYSLPTAFRFYLKLLTERTGEEERA